MWIELKKLPAHFPSTQVSSGVQAALDEKLLGVGCFFFQFVSC